MKKFLWKLAAVICLLVAILSGGYLVWYSFVHIDETRMRVFVNNWWVELIFFISSFLTFITFKTMSNE